MLEAEEEVKAQEHQDDDHDGNSTGGGSAKSDDTPKQKRSKKISTEEEPETHQGKLLLDATCVPADIAYPTDLTLLNEAREKWERMIDRLHAPDLGQQRKPRTYRQKAR